MDKFVDGAKQVTKAVFPRKLLDPLWARYVTATSAQEVSVAASLVASPDKLEEIQRHYAAANNERDFLTIDWLRRRVAGVQDPALKSYFAITADGYMPSLCAPSECYRALVDSIIAVSVQSNLQLGYMLEGQRVLISNYAQLLRDLLARPAIEIRLISGDREFAFIIEKWSTEGGVLHAPRANPITRKIYLDTPSAKAFLASPGTSLDELFPTPMAEETTFDVDVVYTWVNGNDPEWRALLNEHSRTPDDAREPARNADPSESLDPDRYVSRDELRYSLRSLLTFAPWVRQVYVVTNCKPPEWFDETNERVTWVYHEEIIEPENLPTFSSHAIEASIHRIPGLSEHFLYFNDDLFLVKPVNKSDFFLPNGLARTHPEPYGIIHGDLNEQDPDYVNAARNVQALLQTRFEKTATRVHTHSPQSMRLSVIEECEATFPEAYSQTRSKKFRSITDISPTSFMYPNYAYLSGNAIIDFSPTSLVTVNHPYEETLEAYQQAMQAFDYAALPLSLCLNDGGGSTRDPDWGETILRFLTTAFDELSVAEKPF